MKTSYKESMPAIPTLISKHVIYPPPKKKINEIIDFFH